jgi:hypothetical protein
MAADNGAAHPDVYNATLSLGGASLLIQYNTSICATLVVILVLGVALNGSIILLFIRNKHVMYLRDTLLLNLAVSDLLNGLSTCPLLVTCILTEIWPYGISGCVSYAFAFLFFGCISNNTVATISIERLVVNIICLEYFIPTSLCTNAS